MTQGKEAGRVGHTAGPWTVHVNPWNTGKRYTVGRPEVGRLHTLAQVLAPAGGPAGTNAANASLIAAAPTMFTALENARRRFVSWSATALVHGNEAASDKIDSFIAEIDEVLAKARGDA